MCKEKRALLDPEGWQGEGGRVGFGEQNRVEGKEVKPFKTERE